MEPALCDIVVPIWNQPELTRRCLESVLEKTPEPVNLVLVDNGSEEPTRQLLARVKEAARIPVQTLRNPTNLGFVRAVNQGIRASRSPWVLLLNNDTVVTSGWLSEMLRVAESDPSIGLVNPTSNSLGFPLEGKKPEERARDLKDQAGKSTELTTALGFCLLVRRSLLETVGLLDESYGMGNFDDDDLSRRVRATGQRCVRACGAYVYHEEKASFRELPGWEKTFEENRRLFEERWGKRLRILWETASGPGLSNPLAQTALRLTAQGHWICFVSRQDRLPPEVASAAQISQLTLPDQWRLPAAWRLLSKRKKPFDLVVSFDPGWSRWIKRLQILHRAAVLESPGEKEIEEQCRILSRSQ